MNRIDRLSAILIQLQSRRLVTARYLSDRFSISLRTVYRDIHALQEAGVPVIGEAGTGYNLMEGYKLPPVMFNQEEASALLTAAKLMQSKTDANSSHHYSTALDKIRAVLRLAEKDHLEEIETHITVIRHPSFRYEEPADFHLQAILKSIAAGVAITLQYVSIEKNETTQRVVEPVGIYYMGSFWYLVAYCRLRKDYRNFRTDRIEKLSITELPIAKTHPTLQEYIQQMVEQTKVYKVVIDAEKEITKYFGEQKYYNGFVKEEDRGAFVRMTFLAGSLTGFARWFMLYGDKATIVEPDALNQLVAKIALDILKKLGKSNSC